MSELILLCMLAWLPACAAWVGNSEQSTNQNLFLATTYIFRPNSGGGSTSSIHVVFARFCSCSFFLDGIDNLSSPWMCYNAVLFFS